MAHCRKGQQDHRKPTFTLAAAQDSQPFMPVCTSITPTTQARLQCGRTAASFRRSAFFTHPNPPFWPMADPQRAPLLTGWCRRGGKGGALPSKCPLFCQSHQLSNAGHQGTRNLRFVPWRGHGSQSKRGGLDGQNPPGELTAVLGRKRKLGEQIKPPIFLFRRSQNCEASDNGKAR